MKENVKQSIGSHLVNEGSVTIYEDKPYELDMSRKFYLFDVVPMGAVRMTQSDKWKTNPNHLDPLKRQRKVVQRYFNMKNIVMQQAKEMGYVLDKTIDAVFLLPMPDSWSLKKKRRMNKMRHEVKPDWDNLAKGFCDALCKNDQQIYFGKIEKRWAFRGSIIVFA